MKHSLRALAFLAALPPSWALAQSAPATMPYHTVYGRLGAAPGDTGPGQAIPFATLNVQLLNSLCQTNNARPIYSTAQGRWICEAAQAQNLVLAGPTTGANAIMVPRLLVGADLPLPSASTLGGVMSKAAVASNWLRSIGTDGIPTASQPNFTDLAGSIAAGQIPNNLISNAMIRQGVARSVVGVTGNATANEADIQGTADQALVVNSAGTALAFGKVNLTAGAGATGTLPIANGGTGDTGTAWTTFTPSPTCGTATITTTSARSKTLGKTMFLEVDFTITAIGSCSTALTFTLPSVTSASGGGLAGRENVATAGKGFNCGTQAAGTTAVCGFGDGSVLLVNSHVVASGVIEIQ